jgi:hypothetical protein
MDFLFGGGASSSEETPPATTAEAPAAPEEEPSPPAAMSPFAFFSSENSEEKAAKIAAAKRAEAEEYLKKVEAEMPPPPPAPQHPIISDGVMTEETLAKFREWFAAKAMGMGRNVLKNAEFAELMTSMLNTDRTAAAANANLEEPTPQDLATAFSIGIEGEDGKQGLNVDDCVNLYHLIKQGHAKDLGHHTGGLQRSKSHSNLAKEQFRDDMALQGVVGMRLSGTELQLLRDKYRAGIEAGAKGPIRKGLKKDNFKVVVKELTESLGRHRMPTDKDLDAAFDLADEDKSGTVDEKVRPIPRIR